MKKSFLGIMFSLLVISGLASHLQPIEAEEWIIYVPDPSQVDLEFRMINQTGYIDLTITFGTPCYNVSNWGEVEKDGYRLSVKSEIWHWTGICIQVVSSISNTYYLGYLEEGCYTFSFMVWGIEVKTISFAVGVLYSDLNNDGIVDVDDVVIAALAFGSYPTHPRWNILADINQDGVVDIEDVVAIAINFGKTA